MTDHDAQTLMAMHARARRLEAGGYSVALYDLGVATTGKGLFGEAWTPLRRTSRGAHAPLVGMSLGRLEKLGLCRRGRGSRRRGGTSEFHAWGLTEAGYRLADEMMGRGETPA